MRAMQDRYDIAIIGAGMAGASLGAALKGAARIVLLEAESTPGYHATGRSAAFWQETYGGPGVLPLTTASGPALAQMGVLRPRGGLHLARAQDIPALDAFVRKFADLGVDVRPVDRATAQSLVPALRADWVAAAIEPACQDIDVAALHAAYLAQLRQSGATIATRSALVAATRQSGAWHLTLANGQTLRADVLVNAAGAWADPVATIAGASPLGITPYRRTMVQARTAPSLNDTLRLVMDIQGTFYFKPESGRLWLTPHDETATPPCDAAPEEIDVATAIDRLQQVVDWHVEAVEHKWAGLRSFAPDRLPVYGWDAHVAGLFWCAGQGGFGIQTAPAASAMAARLLLGQPGGAIDPAPYAATRFTP
jgi:D-arginine dehydrogenase